MAISIVGNSGTPTLFLAAPQGGAAASVRSTLTVAPEPVQSPLLPSEISQEHIEKAIESIRQLIDAKAPNSLSFTIDDSTGKTIVKISDAQTGEMIRQIPSEELLQIARSVDRMRGLLLQEEA